MPDHALPRIDILAIGEPMVEFNQAFADDPRLYRRGFGGDTQNALIAAARQGARCGYLSRVGDDAFGQQLRALWRDEGIDDSGVATDPGAPTGVYFVHHGHHAGQQGHQFSYLRAGSAASRIRPEDVSAAQIQRARVLHVSGISQAISASARLTVAHAIALARQAGVAVSFDPNLRLKLWTLQQARDALLATLPHTDEFLPSLDDVQQISGLDDAASIADWAHAHGAAHVVLKLGSQGALLSERPGGGLPARRVAVPACHVQAVDATGAGDCFDGSYLARRVAGDDRLDAVRWACAAAALSTLGYGAIEPLPTAEATRAMLQASPSKPGQAH